MRSKLPTSILSVLCTVLALGPLQAQTPVKPLTQDDLLRQIESLSPAGTDPGRSPNRAAKGNPAFNSAAPLFDKKETKPAKPEKKAKGPTEIVALEASFDQKQHVAIFIGQVVVTDPEFMVQADKLTAYLKREEKAADGAAKPAAAEPASKPADKKAKGGGLEKAIAEADGGNVVTVTQEKQELDGSISRSVGHGRKVIYDAVSGDITLYGRPDVQQGINTCVATEDGTVMVLNRDGKMRVTGAHKTVIKESEANK